MGERNTLLGEGKSGNDPRPSWKGPQHYPCEDCRGRVILWIAVAKSDKESRAATLILHIAGSPYRIMQQYLLPLMIIKESGPSRAPMGVVHSIELLGWKFRETAYDREYAGVVAASQPRRTEADLGAFVTRFNLVVERAAEHFAGAYGAPMSKQVESPHLLSASPSDQDRKDIPGSARGDLKGLAGIEPALRRIIVRATPRP